MSSPRRMKMDGLEFNKILVSFLKIPRPKNVPVTTTATHVPQILVFSMLPWVWELITSVLETQFKCIKKSDILLVGRMWAHHSITETSSRSTETNLNPYKKPFEKSNIKQRISVGDVWQPTPQLCLSRRCKHVFLFLEYSKHNDTQLQMMKVVGS